MVKVIEYFFLMNNDLLHPGVGFLILAIIAQYGGDKSLNGLPWPYLGLCLKFAGMRGIHFWYKIILFELGYFFLDIKVKKSY